MSKYFLKRFFLALAVVALLSMLMTYGFHLSHWISAQRHAERPADFPDEASAYSQIVRSFSYGSFDYGAHPFTVILHQPDEDIYNRVAAAILEQAGANNASITCYNDNSPADYADKDGLFLKLYDIYYPDNQTMWLTVHRYYTGELQSPPLNEHWYIRAVWQDNSWEIHRDYSF